MAGTVVHLLTALRLLDALKQKNWRYPFDAVLSLSADYFIAGNICPDGIMARKNYTRSMKLHTHFRDGIPDGSFDNPDKISLFEQRMRAFWETHFAEERECPGLYLGYITHMMTDEQFILEERPRFFKNIAAIGLTEQDAEAFDYFSAETDAVDFKLICQYPELSLACDALKRVPAYEIRGMISRDELTASRRFLIHRFFEETHCIEETHYLKYDRMVSFAENATQKILTRLFAEGYLCL